MMEQLTRWTVIIRLIVHLLLRLLDVARLMQTLRHFLLCMMAHCKPTTVDEEFVSHF